MKKMILLVTALLTFMNFPVKTASAFEISAESGIVIECKTGIILYEKNADKVLPMASTTKLMTALVAVEFGNLDRMMTVSEAAAAVDGSQMGLLAGQQLSFRDLLYMMLLRSGNDAAMVIAENLCGSTEKFVEKMNEKASELGCENTNFENVHGLPHEDHKTTAKELAIIAAEAYKNDVIREVVGSKMKKLDYFSLVIENSNKLLERYEYATGMKTGFTKAAGRCLVSSAEKDGIALIAVTLNAPDDWNDHMKMLDYGFSRVSLCEIKASGEFFAEIPTLNGSSDAKLINTQPLKGLVIDGKMLPVQLEADIPKLIFAPAEAGRSFGSLKAEINGQIFHSVSLALAETVTEKFGEMTFTERFLQRFGKIFFFSLSF